MIELVVPKEIFGYSIAKSDLVVIRFYSNKVSTFQKIKDFQLESIQKTLKKLNIPRLYLPVN